MQPARIVARRDETPDICDLHHALPRCRCAPRVFASSLGQFNMVYAYGVGEVPISIVSDPDEPERLQHTIRLAGRVTTAILRWKVGDVVGVRGPYGHRLADRGRARPRCRHRHWRPRLRASGRRHRLHLAPPRLLRRPAHPARGEDAARHALPRALRGLAEGAADPRSSDQRPARPRLALPHRCGHRAVRRARRRALAPWPSSAGPR